MKCHNFHHFRQYLTYFGQHSSSSWVFFILFLYTPLLLLLLNSLIALFWRTFLNLPMNKQVKVVCHKNNYLHKMPTPKLPPQNGTRSVSPQRSKKQSLLADFSCHFQMLPEMLANSWGPWRLPRRACSSSKGGVRLELCRVAVIALLLCWGPVFGSDHQTASLIASYALKSRAQHSCFLQNTTLAKHSSEFSFKVTIYRVYRAWDWAVIVNGKKRDTMKTIWVHKWTGRRQKSFWQASRSNARVPEVQTKTRREASAVWGECARWDARRETSARLPCGRRRMSGGGALRSPPLYARP